VNDRIRFLRNERDLGVKNGSLGLVEGIESGVLSVKLDGTHTRVLIDTKFYRHLDYGYAATVVCSLVTAQWDKSRDAEQAPATPGPSSPVRDAEPTNQPVAAPSQKIDKERELRWEGPAKDLEL
jgi:hypothetical protein